MTEQHEAFEAFEPIVNDDYGQVQTCLEPPTEV
jgi:hypothetical protein